MAKSLNIFLFILVATGAHSQKLKYKDIFSLLSTNQYEAAEPFLKKYLKETTDNPNAYLYLGIIYEQKAAKDDVLKNTQQAIVNMDSAIMLFSKAMGMITDKEIKKEKDYYAMYTQRDLRTGVMEIKLAHIQHDLQTRSAALRERIDKVKMVKHYFTEMQTGYTRCNEMFVSLQQAYPGQREFYLRADSRVIAQLKELSAAFEASSKAFDNYKTSMSNLGKSSYNQNWNPKAIKDFKSDGSELTDFYQNNLIIWNYKEFADQAVQVIDVELKPLLNDLVTYDIEINNLADKLKADSVSVHSGLAKLTESLLSDKLKKFDPEPLPMDVLGLKIADLDYRSALMESRRLKDSADVFLQVELTKTEIKCLKKVDSLAVRLMMRNIDEEALNYQGFVSSTYNSAALLKSWVKAEREFADREMKQKFEQLAVRTESINWLINGTDSIPLNTTRKSKFRPILIDSKYTAGIRFTDSLNGDGYFFNITPSRKPSIKAQFAIDKANLKESYLQHIKAMIVTDQGESIFFVLLWSNRKVKEGYPATLAKIYRSDGLSWNTNLTFESVPETIQYQPNTGDLLVKLGGDMTVLIDKAGKVK
ncbi:MAG: tetratricopeptide repeat protein [Cyclobacteriaceae bacterium]